MDPQKVLLNQAPEQFFQQKDEEQPVETVLVDVKGLFGEGKGKEDEEEMEKRLGVAVEELRAGGVVAFPTETVYGAGASALSEEVCF